MPICLGICEATHALAAGTQNERWSIVTPLAQNCRYGRTWVINFDMYDFQRSLQDREPTDQSPKLSTLGAELVLAF